MTNAVVVGSGPNGLAAAVTLAEQGVEVTVLEAADTVGGGTRTSELTLPGLRHDDCSAIHTMTAASPFIQSQPLADHGLRWRYPDLDMAHPFDDGSAATLHTSIDETVDGLDERDGRAWRRIFGPLSRNFDDLRDDVFGPIAHVPRHPIKLAAFGAQALLPATTLSRFFRTERARALFMGVAAHVYYPLTRPATSSVGLMITAAGHRYGWPVAEGGSAAIASALLGRLVNLGGKAETGVLVSSLDQIPRADVVMFDLAPRAVADIAGDALPDRVRRAYLHYRHGAAAFKIDIALDGDIPWTNENCRRAGTVHVAGTVAEIVAAEREVFAGRMPARPFVLLCQQYLADPTRSADGRNPIWAYAHVPHGYAGDATNAILSQIERFAPGFRQRILEIHTRGPLALATHNPNYVGGDIATGQNSPKQILLRPRLAADPYSTGAAGMYICSAATPPGVGAHGMGGYNAAQSALRYLDRH